MLRRSASKRGGSGRGSLPAFRGAPAQTAEAEGVAREVAGRTFLYRRVGHDERTLALERDGCIGEGSAALERRWRVEMIDGTPRLVISGRSGVTMALRQDPDGVWRGRWQHHERMPVELVPLAQPTSAPAATPGPLPEARWWSWSRLTPEATALAEQLAGKRFLYRRLGHDERPLRLEAGGRVGEGAGERESRWFVEVQGGAPRLLLGGERGVTVALRRDIDGFWRGRERTSVEVVPLRDAAQKGEALQERPWIITAPVNQLTGYGNHSSALVRGLVDLQVPVRLNGSAMTYQDIADEWWGLLRKPRPGDRHLIIAPPHELGRFDLSRRCVVVTTWESDTLLPEWVENLNKVALVIVPCRWNRECFIRCGVTTDIEIVPEGYDPAVFSYCDRYPAICTFGFAACLTCGGVRKNVELLLEAFSRAFPDEADVRLKLKLTPSCPLPRRVADPRIEVTRAFLAEEELAQWYTSLTAFVNPSHAEGWGLHLLEAMATGRPLISTTYSGVADYFDESVGYPVAYQPAESPFLLYPGSWSEPVLDSLVERLRQVYRDQAEARRLGKAAAERARHFPWSALAERTARVLRDMPTIPEEPEEEAPEDIAPAESAAPEEGAAGTGQEGQTREELEAQLRQARERLATQEDLVRFLLDETQRQARPAAQDPPEEGQGAFAEMYRAFEDRFRGSREEIKSRLRIYLPHVRAAGGGPAVDLGCGRGEWLELMAEEGIRAWGVDSNAGMAEECRARGLEVHEEDALAGLRKLPDAILGVVTGFHILEHLPWPTLLALLRETARVLRPGGLAIFETPNPENLLVGACHFYGDPTHQRPLFPPTLQFAAEQCGLGQVEVVRANQDRWMEDRLRLLPPEEPLAGSLNPLIEIVKHCFFSAPDYAIVCRRGQGSGVRSQEAGIRDEGAGAGSSLTPDS